MDKIARTKLAMLVTVVILTIFTTIGLYYTMTVSNVTSVGNSDPLVLNISMVLAIIIAFMWVIALILFYEFKTDEALKVEIHNLIERAATLESRATNAESRVTVAESRASNLEEYNDMLKSTVFTPAVCDPDVLKEGGVTGHIPFQ